MLYSRLPPKDWLFPVRLRTDSRVTTEQFLIRYAINSVWYKGATLRTDSRVWADQQKKTVLGGESTVQVSAAYTAETWKKVPISRFNNPFFITRKWADIIPLVISQCPFYSSKNRNRTDARSKRKKQHTCKNNFWIQIFFAEVTHILLCD